MKGLDFSRFASRNIFGEMKRSVHKTLGDQIPPEVHEEKVSCVMLWAQLAENVRRLQFS